MLPLYLAAIKAGKWDNWSMVQSVTRTITATAAAGIIIAGASYFFFTARPASLTDGIEITYQSQTLPTKFFAAVIGKVSPPERGGAQPLVDAFQDYFSFSRVSTLGTFHIKNDSGRHVQNLLYNGDPHLLAEVTDATGERTIEEASKTATLSVLPGETASVVVLMRSQQFSVPGIFTVEGQGVIVREVGGPYGDLTPSFYRDWPGVTFMLMAAGALLILGFVGFLIIGPIIILNPYKLATMSTSDSLGHSLAVLNFLKIENPAKFQRAVKVAERYYEKWMARLPKEGSSAGEASEPSDTAS